MNNTFVKVPLPAFQTAMYYVDRAIGTNQELLEVIDSRKYKALEMAFDLNCIKQFIGSLMEPASRREKKQEAQDDTSN